MTNSIENKYYKKLASLSLTQLVIFLALILLVTTANIIAVYVVYIPDLLKPLQHLPSTSLASLESGLRKIVLNLSLWLFVLFIVNAALIYLVWCAKKYLVKSVKNG